MVYGFQVLSHRLAADRNTLQHDLRQRVALDAIGVICPFQY